MKKEEDLKKIQLIENKELIHNQIIIGQNYGDIHISDVSRKTFELIFHTKETQKVLGFHISRLFQANFQISKKDSFIINLAFLVEFYKKVVLLGDAGLGKTTELKVLNNQLLEKGLHVCFLRLKNFEKFGLNFFINKEDSNNQKERAVIIDGLDELNGERYSEAIDFINVFSNQYPKLTIVVSCRTNIYSHNLEGFKAFTLQKFTDTDIKQYLEFHIENKKNHFLNLIPSVQIKELIRIPFYLDKAVKYYQTNKRLPKDVIILLEYFIDESVKVRINDDSNLPISKPEREKCLRLVQTFAFVMECQGINSLSIESFQKLIGEETLVKLVFEKSSLIYFDNNQVQFSHRIIQEYLAATILAQSKNFKTIHSVLTVDAGKSKIKNNWLNVVSYLVRLLDEKEKDQKKILNWLVKDNLESLIKMEKESFPKAFREENFMKLFHRYKKQERLFRYDVELEQLVNFGGSLNVLEKLIPELGKNNPIESRVNALELLPLFEKIELTTSIRDSVKDGLLPFIFEDDNGVALIRSLSIQAYLTLVGFQEPELEKLVNIFLNSNHQPTREAVRNAIIASELEDKFLDELLVQFGTSINQELNVNHLDSNHIGNTLKGIKDLDSILKYLKFYQQNFDNTIYQSFRYTTEEIVKKINQEFLDDETLFLELMKSFVLRLDDFGDKVNAHIFEWIKKSNKRHEVFLFVYNHFPKIEAWIVHRLAVIAEAPSIEFFANEFINKKIDRRNVEVFQQTLDEFREYDLLESFNQLINKEGIIPHLNSERIKSDLTEQQVHFLRKKKIIFDKEFFINQVLTAFENERDINNEILTKFSQQNLFPKIYQHEIVWGLERVLNEGENISKEELVDKINKHWDCCISAMNIELLMRLTLWGTRNIEFNKEEKDKIRIWCKYQLEFGNIDFRGNGKIKGIMNREENKFFERCFFRFCEWFKDEAFEEFNDELYLDMLSFHANKNYQSEGVFSFVEQKVKDSNKIARRVVENLKEGIDVNEVLVNHVSYAADNHLKEVRDLIPKYLFDEKNYHCYFLAEKYLRLGGKIERFEGLLEEKKIGENLRSDLIRLLSKEGNDKIEEILIKGFISEKEEDKKAGLSSFLLKYGNIDALRYRVKPVLEYSNWNTDIFNRDKNWTNIDGLEIIIGVYLFSFSKEPLIFKNNRFLYGFAQRALSGIKSIAFYQNNYLEVKKRISRILDKENLELGDDSNLFPSVQFSKESFKNLRRDWELLEEEYYRKESRRISMKEAQTKYFELIRPKANWIIEFLMKMKS